MMWRSASTGCLIQIIRGIGYPQAADFRMRKRCSCRNGSNQLRSEEHTSELQSPDQLVCRLLLEKKKSHRLLHAKHTAPTGARAVPPPGPATPVMESATRFFFNDTATTEIYTLSLHDALPI